MNRFFIILAKMKCLIFKKHAFTLIELLVVIVVIGILSGIGISSFNSYQNKAKVAVAESAINQIQKAIITAHTLQEKTLIEITGSTNSGKHCPGSYLPYSQTLCQTAWNSALTMISEKSLIDLSEFQEDPWGVQFVLDENMGEYGASDCRLDFLGSAGPDGIMQTSFSNASNVLGDDIVFTVPPYTKSCQ